MDNFCSGGQLLRVSVCITPPSMQNVTTSSFKNIKDENKLNPARMLSGNVPDSHWPWYGELENKTFLLVKEIFRENSTNQMF